jgi:transcriptional regulator with XRE-family HTH domain
LEKRKRQKRAIHHVDPNEIKETVGEGNEKTKLFFSIQLNELLCKKETAQEDLAKKTGLSMSSISTYRNGKAEPKITAFNEIANALNVSADYLLGNTTVTSPKPEMQAACEYTGLSEDAINIIKKYSEEHNEKPLLEILNTLFEEGIMTSLIKALENFVLFTHTGKLTFSYTSDKPRSIPIDPKIIAEWFLDMELERAAEKIKETMLNRYL